MACPKLYFRKSMKATPEPIPFSHDRPQRSVTFLPINIKVSPTIYIILVKRPKKNLVWAPSMRYVLFVMGYCVSGYF